MRAQISLELFPCQTGEGKDDRHKLSLVDAYPLRSKIQQHSD
jgi:hypothetical protein